MLDSIPGGLPLVMGVLAAAVLAYAAYLLVDQNGSIVYEVPRTAARFVAPAIFVGAAVVNYFAGGRGPEQLGVGAVLLAFAALMLVARTGVGRAGIYADGVRRAWARIDEVSVTSLEGGAGARVTWGARGSSRDLDLPGANPDEVREFVREMRRSH